MKKQCGPPGHPNCLLAYEKQVDWLSPLSEWPSFLCRLWRQPRPRQAAYTHSILPQPLVPDCRRHGFTRRAGSSSNPLPAPRLKWKALRRCTCKITRRWVWGRLPVKWRSALGHHQQRPGPARGHHSFDPAGNVTSMVSSNENGASVSYTYDQLSRLSTVVDGRLPIGFNTTSYFYDPVSNLATATYPNGLQSSFTYL
jgi:YD repeat-containing protein